MKPEEKTVRLSEIVFDPVIYPRRAHDPALVQRYAGVLDEIEAKRNIISVAADLKLLDGKHRWLAYKKRYGEEDREIPVRVYPVNTPHEQLELSAELNSAHGAQLSREDKEDTAKALYAYGFSYERIAAALSVGKAKVGEWLATVVKENKDRRDRQIRDLWLASYTQSEIAEEVGCDQKTVTSVCDSFRNSVLENQNPKTAFFGEEGFTKPLYNIRSKGKKSEGVEHFGNTEPQWLDNLVCLYSAPFDLVIDPFAGGGSTIDVCKKRLRRYLVSDRRPIVEREEEIRRHDITDGLLKPPQWSEVKLVYLDPPYWRQAQGRYSDDPTDLANMELEEFNATLAGLINNYGKKLKNQSAFIALVIQPTQWSAPGREFTDHVHDMIRLVKLPVDMRYSAPYSTQQYSAQQVQWAQENNCCLVLTREIIVWRTGPAREKSGCDGRVESADVELAECAS